MSASAKWRVRDIFTVLVIYGLVMTALYTVAAIALGTDVLEASKSPAGFVLIENVIGFCVFVFAPTYIVTQRYQVEIDEIGLATIVRSNAVLAGVFSGIVLWAAATFLEYLVNTFLWPVVAHPDLERLRSADTSSVDHFSLLVSVLVLTPISEEVYSRGFVYTILRNRYGVAVAVVASSLLFAALHVKPWYFIQTFVVGAGLAWLRERYRSIVPAILAHMVINLLAVW